MQYGISVEPKVREAYIQATEKKVRETGLSVNKKFPLLGVSPDEIVTECDGKTGTIEIKCLKVLNYKSVENFLQQ